MLLPLRDMNPTRRLPLMTWLLIIANTAVFWWELRARTAGIGDQKAKLKARPSVSVSFSGSQT